MGLSNEDIKQLITILSRGLEQDDEKATKTKSTGRKTANKSNKKQTNNDKVKEVLGIDLSSLHKEDILIDKKLSQSSSNNKMRRSPCTLIDVKCRVCNKTEKINPSLLFESASRYKCNTCSSSPG